MRYLGNRRGKGTRELRRRHGQASSATEDLLRPVLQEEHRLRVVGQYMADRLAPSGVVVFRPEPDGTLTEVVPSAQRRREA